MEAEIRCAHFRPLARHEDTISLPDELNRGLCAVSGEGRPVIFADMTCENAAPAYREYPEQ